MTRTATVLAIVATLLVTFGVLGYGTPPSIFAGWAERRPRKIGPLPDAT